MASRSTVLRQLYPFRTPSTSIDHLVIGGGAIGLSVAAGLVNLCGSGRTTFLVERRGLVGHDELLRLGLTGSAGVARAGDDVSAASWSGGIPC